MNTTRLLAIPAIAAAALLTLSGCFQLPGAPTTGGGSSEGGSSEGGSSDGGSSTDLSNTSWSGTDAAGNVVDVMLNSDGTVDIETFGDGGPYDDPNDTWTVSGDQIEIYISKINDIGGLTYSGQVAEGSMDLTGVDDNGDSGYDITLSEG